MSRIVIREGESFEGALKRFKKKVQTDRVLSEVRRRRFFEKPSVIKKRKKATKLRKSRRQTRKGAVALVSHSHTCSKLGRKSGGF